MGIKLHRGRIQGLTLSAKDSSAECRVGDRQVKIHPNLVKLFAEGDEVMVAGEVKNDVMHVMAAKSYKQDKTDHIDATNYILILGVAGYVWILAGVFGLEADVGDWVGRAQELASVIGFIIVCLAVRRIILVNRASNWIDYAEINEAAKAKGKS